MHYESKYIELNYLHMLSCGNAMMVKGKPWPYQGMYPFQLSCLPQCRNMLWEA